MDYYSRRLRGQTTDLCILGSINTLSRFLDTHLPLLFPADRAPLAYALIQGVLAPPEAEMAWLGACLAGADGWVNICVGLLREGIPRF